MEEFKQENYERAKKRVKELKGFYEHLTIYIIVNVTIQVIKMDVLDFITNGRPFDWDLTNWWNWNVHSVWFIWGIILAIHAYKVFKDDISFGKDWEDRKIKELMDEEEREQDKQRWV